jgi:hypothetical protein
MIKVMFIISILIVTSRSLTIISLNGIQKPNIFDWNYIPILFGGVDFILKFKVRFFIRSYRNHF